MPETADNPFLARHAPLRGIIVRDDDDKVIVQATTRDIREFAPQPGQPVEVQQAELRMRVRNVRARMVNFATTEINQQLESGGVLRRGEPLYDREGRAVAVIRRVTFNADMQEISTFGGTRQMITGLEHVEIDAEGLPGIRIE